MAEESAQAEPQEAKKGKKYALLIGITGGWYVVTGVLELHWAPDPLTIAGTLAAAVVTTLGIGVASSLPALRATPAAGLRTD